MLGLSSWIDVLLTVYCVPLGAIIIVGAYAEFLKRRPLRALLSRGDMTRTWCDRFPDAGVEEISAFLALFTKAFHLPKHSEFKLSPDDRVMDILRVLHPVLRPTRFRFPGMMERDGFVMGLMDKYDTFVEPDEQLTLGQAFAQIAMARPD